MVFSKIRAAALLFLLALAGCDAQRVQDGFEEQASQPPSGYTSTDRKGAVGNTDPDDWRTAPLYAGKVYVDPAYPNPTVGETVTINVLLSGYRGRLSLRGYRSDGRLVELDALNEGLDGGYFLQFSPAALGRLGLVRVFLLDGATGDFVSYGDVLLN